MSAFSEAYRKAFPSPSVRGVLSLWGVFRGNKQDAKTLGEFLTYAVDHLRGGGNCAYCTTTLSDGTPVKVSIERVTQSDASEKHGS